MGANEERLRGLMVKALTGDKEAYQVLLKDLSVHLRAFYRRRLTHCLSEVEDLVQETLLAVHNQRHTYQASQPLTAWVYAIARYKLIDMLRRRTGHEALNDPLDDEEEIFAASDNDAMEARRDLTKLLEQLPERQRLAIQYVKLDGLSVKEAASLARMSESAVKIGVHRGMRALAALIKGKP